MHLTPLGPEFEAIIAATTLFLLGGALSFICCFCITHGYIWHKRRIYRNRLRHEWSEETDSTSAEILPQPQPQVIVVEQSKNANANMNQLSKQQKYQYQFHPIPKDQRPLRQMKRVVVIDTKMPPNSNENTQTQNSMTETKRAKPSETEPSSALQQQKKYGYEQEQRQKKQRMPNVAFECGSATGTEETNSS